MSVISGGERAGGGAPGASGAEPAGGQLFEEAGDLPPRSRGVIALLAENCTVCMLCARECPDWCIYIDGHKEPVPGAPAAPGGRTRTRNALDRFAIDFSLCMYCGICVEVCPYDALFWAPDFAYPAGSRAGLLHEQERLGEWMAGVPPAPAPDPGAPEPSEPPRRVPGPTGS